MAVRVGRGHSSGSGRASLDHGSRCGASTPHRGRRLRL